jgi:hypothetical protein
MIDSLTPCLAGSFVMRMTVKVTKNLGQAIETALHRSLHDTQFRFVNIAHWTSEDEFNAAVGSQGFQEAASDLGWPFHPALYQVVRTG